MISMVLTSGLKNLYTSAYHEEYVMDSQEDKDSLVTDCAPGSLAYTSDLSHIYMLSNGRTWEEIVDGQSGTPGSESVYIMRLSGDTSDKSADDIATAAESGAVPVIFYETESELIEVYYYCGNGEAGDVIFARQNAESVDILTIAGTNIGKENIEYATREYVNQQINIAISDVIELLGDGVIE